MQRIAVAIARYYFYSGTAAVAPLLNLTNSGSGSDAIINKVAVAHLCPWDNPTPWYKPVQACACVPRHCHVSYCHVLWVLLRCVVGMTPCSGNFFKTRLVTVAFLPKSHSRHYPGLLECPQQKRALQHIRNYSQTYLTLKNNLLNVEKVLPLTKHTSAFLPYIFCIALGMSFETINFSKES